MRILDNDSDKKSDNVTIMLTESEALELRDALVAILANKKEGRHEHICNSDFTKEITIVIYDALSTNNAFNSRIQKLLDYDK